MRSGALSLSCVGKEISHQLSSTFIRETSGSRLKRRKIELLSLVADESDNSATIAIRVGEGFDVVAGDIRQLVR